MIDTGFYERVDHTIALAPATPKKTKYFASMLTKTIELVSQIPTSKNTGF